MVSIGILSTVACLTLYMVLNGMQLGEGLAADRYHRRSLDEPAATDAEKANTDDFETTKLQNSRHSEASVAMHDSANHSREEMLLREVVGKLPQLTVANRSLSKIHSHRNASTSVSESTANKTAANLNVSFTEHAFNDNRSSTSDSADTANYSQAENVARATLCPNGTSEKETMRIEVEFASTLLENGLYYQYFVTINGMNIILN